ncbi:AgmX/PglI C-terminal domain-containing protein [candidate division KSB1 bacterium]|nr:AgmX/PglI C-terminal domain-containing protein [candidate division KSB1 bacterium]
MQELPKNARNDEEFDASFIFDMNANDELILAKFPREFRRSLSDLFDTRYLIILVGAFILHIAAIIFFLTYRSNEEPARSEIQNNQNRFVSLMLKDLPTTSNPETAETTIKSMPSVSNWLRKYKVIGKKTPSPINVAPVAQLPADPTRIAEKPHTTNDVALPGVITPTSEMTAKTNTPLPLPAPTGTSTAPGNLTTAPGPTTKSTVLTEETKNKRAPAPVAVQSAPPKTAVPGKTNENRRVSQSRNQTDVNSQGLLGVLSATASNTSDQEIADVLGDPKSNRGNLQEVLSNIGSGKALTAPGQGSASTGKTGTEPAPTKTTRGSRTKTKDGIEDQIDRLGAATAKDLGRQGNLVVVENMSIIENTGNAKGSAREEQKVMAVVNAHNSAIQSCFQRAERLNPNLKGKIVVRFIISYLGKVTQAEILSSTFNDESVESCILNRIRKWDDFGVIEPEKGDATVRQVYTFGY